MVKNWIYLLFSSQEKIIGVACKMKNVEKSEKFCSSNCSPSRNLVEKRESLWILAKSKLESESKKTQSLGNKLFSFSILLKRPTFKGWLEGWLAGTFCGTILLALESRLKKTGYSILLSNDQTCVANFYSLRNLKRSIVVHSGLNPKIS